MSPFENRKEEVINEFQPEDFDVDDTEFIYPRELVRPENPPLEGENSRDSSLMNRSADSDPEMLNPAHVERKRSDPCQRKTLRNYRISGKMETENTSMDSEDETENSFREKKKIDIIPFVSSPEDFVLPPYFNRKERSFNKNSMWSALMSVKNGMSASKASQKYKIANQTLKNYMKKYGADHPEQVLMDDFKTELFDVEDTELIYSRDLVLPANPIPEEDIESIREIGNSGESSLMNRSAESVPEIVNSTHVERKKRNLRQRRTLRNYRNFGELDFEDDNENSSRTVRKIDKIPFVLPPNSKRSYNRTTMWSALMSVKNGMSASEASQKYKIANQTLHDYLKKYGIKSKFSQKYSKSALNPKQSQL
ncbi:hypothetical protein DMENIID0001_136360 [Sergentomyia squamirostris]